MRAFTIVWLGQVVSLLGTAMTQFALTLWAYQLTGQATALALMGFFTFGPTVLLSPVAGALVDRWNRKLVMMLSDLGAALATLTILLLFLAGRLEIWHLYVAGAFAGAFQAFQFPAYSAAITMMLPKEQYARASGMLSLAESASQIAAPVMAAALIGIIGIGGILAIDLATFVVALVALLIVSIPQPPVTAAGREGSGSLLEESLYGFRYILRYPSLLGLLLTFFAVNFIGTFAFILAAPLVLARTSNNQLVLGTVQSIGGVGGVVGGLLLSVWGGPRRKIDGVLGGFILESIFGVMLIGLGRGLFVWAAGLFFSGFMLPILNGSSQAIWQAKVAPDVQGRVFSVRRLIAQITAPVAMLLAGPLADYVFEPAMAPGGAWSGAFGGLVGTGPGAGISLIFIIAGLLGALVGVVGYAIPVIRDVETILPDHDAGGTSLAGSPA